MKTTYLLNSFLVLALLLGIAPTARSVEPLNTLNGRPRNLVVDNPVEPWDRPIDVFGDLMAPSVVQSSTQNVELLAHIGGVTKAVFVQGNYVYLGEGPMLTVLDISLPISPTVVGKMGPLSGNVQDVYVSGSYAYVVAKGLWVVDVSDPVHPTPIGFLSERWSINSVRVSGSTAYVLDRYKAGGWMDRDLTALRVVDVSDPANPTEIGSYSWNTYSQRIFVSDDVAYIVGESQDLRVVDVSNPASPIEIGLYDVEAGNGRDIFVADSTAYLTFGYNGLWILDVSDPANPIKIGSYDGYAARVLVSESTAYLAASSEGLRVLDVSDPTTPIEIGSYDNPEYHAQDVFFFDDIAYVIKQHKGLGGLQLLDVSNPAAPSEIGSYDTPINPLDTVVSGSTAYIADGYGGLQTWDVSNPISPTSPTITADNTSGGALDVFLSGNLVYVAEENAGLQTWDVSNPISPTLIGSYNGSKPRRAKDVVVSGSVAYVTDTDYNSNGLRLLDVSDPTHPAVIGSYDTPGDVRGGVVVSGNIAYLADGPEGGLRVVDVSDPTNPIELGFCDTPWTAVGVFVSGNIAYVADGYYGGLRVVDVSDPGNPTEIGFNDAVGDVRSVFVSGYIAYVAAGMHGLRIVDVSNPADPTEIGVYDTLGTANDIFVSESIAYLADGFDSGLRVVDVSDPTNPTEIGFYGTPSDDIWSIFVSGSVAYVAAIYNGLRMVDVSNPTDPTLLGFYDLSGGVFVSDGMAYIAAGKRGLRVLDVNNSASPIEIGACWAIQDTANVFVSDDIAYVIDREIYIGGLRMLDVSDPANLTGVGFYEEIQQNAEDVFVSGNVAYLADGYSGLWTLDVSDPANLIQIGSYALPGRFVDVFVSGNTAYVADASGSFDDRDGLRVLDVSDPTNPTEIGSYDMQDSVQNVFVASNTVYVTGESSGLRVLDVGNPASPIEIGSYEGVAGEIFVLGDTIYIAAGSGGFFILHLTSTISGEVTDSNGTPFSSVTVSAGSGISTTTDADGYYIIGNLDAGTYTLTPTLSGYAFWPPIHTITVPPYAGGQDFTILPAPVSATLVPSGTLWLPYTLTYTDTQGLPTSLVFPAGAVTQSTTIVLTPTLVAGSPGWDFAGHAFDLAAYRDGTSLSNLTFGAPVTTTIHYNDADVRVVADENELTLRWWDGITWADAATTCGMTASIYNRDVNDNVLSVPICRLGRYALLGSTHQVFLPLVTRRAR